MKGLKSHFVFSRSERNGIFILIGLIIIGQLEYFFFQPAVGEELNAEETVELESFLAEIDSLKRSAVTDSTYQYRFNPNFMTDGQAYRLGLSVEEIDRLHAFRRTNQWVRSAEEFQEVTGISDSLLQTLASQFHFPQWAERQQERRDDSSRPEPTEVKNLNIATAEELRRVYGIGPVLSERIVRFRESLGGFSDERQLYDVYGLDSAVVERVLKRFRIEILSDKEKPDINNLQVTDLLDIPGIDYEIARKITALRDEKGRIVSFEELLEIPEITAEEIDRINLYLRLKEEPEEID